MRRDQVGTPGERRRVRIPTFLEAILLTISALFPIMNPFSTAPLFLALSAGFAPAELKRQAFMACVYAFAILVVFLLSGAAIVDFFGISIPGVRVAGGLIISAIGFRMLLPAPEAQRGGQPDAPGQDIAFTPLAMPSLAGPGSIAVVLTAAAQIRYGRPDDWLLVYAGVIAGMAVCLLIAYAVLRMATVMLKVLGRGGIDAMTRVFGFLLICIAMQFLLTGIDEFFGIRAALAG